MLARTPSLALRASLIFAAAYGTIFLSVLLLSTVASILDRGNGNQRGPILAVRYAAADLREHGDRLQLRTDGRFADLSARNPSIWLVVVRNGQVYTSGAVSRPLLQAVKQLQGVVGPATFRLPGAGPPRGIGAIERQDSQSGPGLIAAGGVDPVTLSTAESAHLLLQPGTLGILAVIAAIGLAAMTIAAPSFTRALRSITDEANAIGPHDPGLRLHESKAPRELLPLVRGFNAALNRLEVELGRRKRFVADVAHELRTPLAVLSLRVDALPHDERREDLRRGLNALTNIVSQMLDVERLSLAGQQRVPIDLVATARDAVADLAPRAIREGYDLSLIAPDAPVVVIGDSHAIMRALTNVIGNAITHAGGDGPITVTVDASGTIEVADEGPGIAIALQSRLFEPFVRGNTSSDGCGLGLHLTRAIMDAHGGTVQLIEQPRGAALALGFPLA